MIIKVTLCVVTEHTAYFIVTTFSECYLLARNSAEYLGQGNGSDITWPSRDSPSGRGHSAE